MSLFRHARSFLARVLVLAAALGAWPGAAGARAPLRIAVARPAVPAPENGRCAELPADSLAPVLGAALSDSLRARSLDAVADGTLAAWLRRLDATRFPDPRDYGRARDYIAATGAGRLLYVNDLRVTEACVLRFESALWNTEPLGRLATHADSAATPAQAARLLAEWLAPRLRVPASPTPEKP